MPILFGTIASSNQQARADTGVMFPLGMVQVGSAGTATVTFSSIPSTYKHLQIRGILRTASDQSVLLTFNSISSTYKNHYLEGSGSSVSAGAETNSGIALYGLSVSNANIFGGFIWDILDYADTNKNKVLRALQGYDRNGSGYLDFDSGLWVNTSAITSVTIVPTGGTTFQQYSQFALYGIKGA